MFYELEQLANVKKFFGFRAGEGAGPHANRSNQIEFYLTTTVQSQPKMLTEIEKIVQHILSLMVYIYHQPIDGKVLSCRI